MNDAAMHRIGDREGEKVRRKKNHPCRVIGVTGGRTFF